MFLTVQKSSLVDLPCIQQCTVYTNNSSGGKTSRTVHGYGKNKFKQVCLKKLVHITEHQKEAWDFIFDKSEKGQKLQDSKI